MDEIYNLNSAGLIGSLSNRNEIGIYIRNLRLPEHKNHFHELDREKSWKLALCGAKILEHPVIFLASKSFIQDQAWTIEPLPKLISHSDTPRNSHVNDKKSPEDGGVIQKETCFSYPLNAIKRDEIQDSHKLVELDEKKEHPSIDVKIPKYDFKNISDW